MSLLPRVIARPNQRFLSTIDGQPFFWMGDTAWELFHRLTREEAEVFFANRQARRFNVIQAVALAEFDGLNTANRYGHCPLFDNDPYRPNEFYFALVDEYIHMAEVHDLYIALLPTWGDKVMPMWGTGPVVFTPKNAYSYGLFLGRRYRDRTNVIWVLGGDRPMEHEGIDYRPVWREMARGIREGVDGPLLMTCHPSGGHSTGEWIHDENWLNMNMMQSGHGGGHDVPVWDMITADYTRVPAKPTLDGEPNYEDHPVSPWPVWDPATGHYDAHDVRKQLYRSVFAGGCGVTYGHHSVWQFYQPPFEPINYPLMPWQEAILRPAAGQVQYLRGLMESRPYFDRIPDQSLLAAGPVPGKLHAQATRDAQGRYAFVYLPESDPVEISLDRLAGPRVTAQWYDPRNGEWRPAGEGKAQGTVLYVPPAEGPDWVLVLDSVE
jgi:hypothetical protein